jgi:hypothetical protein
VSYDGLAKRNYGWKAATAYCYIKNVLGQQIAGFKVRYPTDLKYGLA